MRFLAFALVLSLALTASADPPAARAPRVVMFRHREESATRRPLAVLSRTERGSLGDGPTVSKRVSRIFFRPHDRARQQRAFVVRRDMAGYRAELPQLPAALTQAVRRHGPDAHWLDLGAGDGLATADYMRVAGGGRVTALAYRVGSAAALRAWRDVARTSSPRSRYLVGSYLHEYSAEEIGLADVVTDYFGPASYHRQIDEVVHQIGTLTREGADVFLVVSGLHPTDRNFEAQWLRQCSGFTVQSIRSSAPRYAYTPGAHMDGWAPTFRIHLKRTSAPLRIPALELTEFADDSPPRRHYERGQGFVGDAS